MYEYPHSLAITRPSVVARPFVYVHPADEEVEQRQQYDCLLLAKQKRLLRLMMGCFCHVMRCSSTAIFWPSLILHVVAYPPCCRSSSCYRSSCCCRPSRRYRLLQPPLCLPSSLTVLEVAKRMADVRTDAAILLDSQGHLEGIITDNDVAR